MPAYDFFFLTVNMELPDWTELGFSFLQLFCEVKGFFLSKSADVEIGLFNFFFFLKDGMFAWSDWCLYCSQLSLARRRWLKAPWGRLMLLQIDERELLRKPSRKWWKEGNQMRSCWQEEMKKGVVLICSPSYSNSCLGKINGFLLPGARHFLATIVNVE